MIRDGLEHRAALHAGTAWIDALDLRASAPRTARDAGPVIPRIIHQTYHAKDLPEVLRDAVAALRALNPEWEHRLYDDDDIEHVITAMYPPEVLQLYRRIDPAYGAARADLFRYLLMYRCGGVYLDVKAQMTTPLRDVLRDDDTFVSAHWRNGPGELHDGFGRFPTDTGLSSRCCSQFSRAYFVLRLALSHRSLPPRNASLQPCRFWLRPPS